VTTLQYFFNDLSRFDVAAYEQAVRRSGRAALKEDSALVTQVQRLAADASALRASWPVSKDRQLSQTVEAARLFFAAQFYLLTHDKPRYEPYASVSLLRCVLQATTHQSLHVTRHRIWRTFQQLLHAQMEFEMLALSGLLTQPTEQFSPDVSRERLSRLAEIQPLIPRKFSIISLRVSRDDGDFKAIAEDNDGGGIIDRLLVYPQTICHDETAFIRSIQLAECLFWGTLIHVRRALVALSLDQVSDALQLLRTACEFAAPLVRVFQAVRAMPPEHFLGFRDATGDASAVQSVSWQLLDAHVYGVLPEKAPVLADIPEVRHVLRLFNPHFVPLITAVQETTSAAASQLAQTATELDHRLRGWRKFHERQLAGQSDPGYLPAEAQGTGGTSGYGYLASHRPPRFGVTAAAVGDARTARGGALANG
jgi:hypothetical protein